jgi:hypothetical protein
VSGIRAAGNGVEAPAGPLGNGVFPAVDSPAGHGTGLTTPPSHTLTCGDAEGRVPPYAAPPLREKLVSSSGRQKTKARRSLSLPLLTYSALGGLRQDPGRAAESSAEATICGNEGTTCGCCCRSTYGGCGDVEPVLGLAVRLRPADSSEGRQREMGTCPTRGSTEREAPVIRSAGAVRRSTAASEVSQ